MSRLLLPRSIYDALRAHGEEAYPNECCGALLGRPGPGGWRIFATLRAGNACIGSARHRYEIAPIELVHIEGEARRRGLEIAGFYHSHPGHPAQWSPTDFAEAHWIGCSYVITEIAHGKAAATQSYLLAGATEEDKRFEFETIVIEDESSGAPPQSNLEQ
ncbi:MAG: Mov34/MPN/PAD-1 family protein [Acidobacteriota bacterium]